jgi:hypothetical protein
MNSDKVTMVMATMILAAAVVAASAEALPYAKDSRQCSGDYVQSGAFCVPKTAGSRPSVPKPPGGQCPAGWSQSGGSCRKS